jgi:hypothetical protein
MKKLSIIMLVAIAGVLVGMAVWQLKWMSDVVDNYDAAQYTKRPDPKVNIEENTFQDKGTHTVTPDQPAEEEAAIVPDGPSHADSEDVTGLAVKEAQAVLDSPDSTIKDADSNDPEASGNGQITIREDDNTISIKLKSDKPLPPRRQVVTSSPVSQRKALDIPAPSVTQHATSTSPY